MVLKQALGDDTMEYKHERAAYNSLPIPQDLPKEEYARYLMLCLIYRQYREGILERDIAEVFKKLVCNWEAGRTQDKAAVLRYCIANAFEDATKQGQNTDWGSVWTMMMEYMGQPLARSGSV